MTRRRPPFAPNASGSRVRLTAPAAAAAVRGHPWVYREGLADRGHLPWAPGTVIELADPQGGPIGSGLWDPDSPIAVRVVSLDPNETIDVPALAARLAKAAARRRAWFSDPARTDAYRLCNGEGDRLPGLVIDRYADWVIVRTDGAAMERLGPEILLAARPSLEALGIRGAALRRSHGDTGSSSPEGGASALSAESRSAPAHRRSADRAAPAQLRPPQTKLEPLFGPPPPDSIAVHENGWAMLVDLARGQKTGAFLDQRENRASVAAMASGKRVLNLFSYAGGFSLAAALGGAKEVTSVDIAKGAHATAQKSFRLNELAPESHRFVTADVFAFLETARASGERWDLVISDPPSFAPNERSVPRALAAYRKLHRACAEVLAQGGTFCAASCSSHVNLAAFLATLDDASLARADLSVLAALGPPRDHPIVAGWTEGLYLKWVVLA